MSDTNGNTLDPQLATMRRYALLLAETCLEAEDLGEAEMAAQLALEVSLATEDDAGNLHDEADGRFVGKGGPRSRKKATAPKRDTHPLSGKSKDETIAAMLPHARHDAASADPWGLAGAPLEELPDGPAVAARVADHVREFRQANPFRRPTVKQAFEAVKKDHAGMELLDFQRVLARMQRDGSLVLGPYTGAPAANEELEYALPLDREHKQYLELPGGARLAVEDDEGHLHGEADGKFVSKGGGEKSKGTKPAKEKLLRGTSEVVVESSPVAFVVRLTLKDAELPDIHHDNLPAIGFTEGYFPFSRVGEKISEAYGIYDVRSQKITLASNARSQNNDVMNRMGTGNVAVLGGAVVLHEVGHHVHIAKMTDEAADEWEKLSRKGTAARISAYAQTNQGEHFAEAYRAYARGGNDRKKLKVLEPESYKFMQRLWNDSRMFLPKGELSGAEKFERRYFGKTD